MVMTNKLFCFSIQFSRCVHQVQPRTVVRTPPGRPRIRPDPGKDGENAGICSQEMPRYLASSVKGDWVDFDSM